MFYFFKNILLSFIIKIYVTKQKDCQYVLKDQKKILKQILKLARNTEFGKEHNFSGITSYQDFKKKVPIRSYEQFIPYINKLLQGEKNILWKGKPLYLAKTSGTTSGIKYIPITKASMSSHISGAKKALFNYAYLTQKAHLFGGKMMFLQGNPSLEIHNGIKIGRLSGIVAHYVPKYLTKNNLPSLKTNCIEDWETKINAIINETADQDMRIISGIPPWLVMYFEKLKSIYNKPIGDLFPKLACLLVGGVNFEPYRKKIDELIGRPIDYIELYPASEGFIAYQDNYKKMGMLLNTNGNMFYEFVPISELHLESPKRYNLAEIKLGIDYALLISSNAGLWAYNIGDTVRFISKNPYKLIVSGRTTHFISAFGEHVIVKEIEEALKYALEKTDALITEFTVAPQITPTDFSLPYHEWWIEFQTTPKNLDYFASLLDKSMVAQNIYYKDLIEGKILRPLIIRKVAKGGFKKYMHSIGKLGEQFKPPHLSNTRDIVAGLQNYLEPI